MGTTKCLSRLCALLAVLGLAMAALAGAAPGSMAMTIRRGGVGGGGAGAGRTVAYAPHPVVQTVVVGGMPDGRSP